MSHAEKFEDKGIRTGDRVALITGEYVGRWGYMVGYPGDGCCVKVLLAGIHRKEIVVSQLCLAKIKS